MRLFQSFRGPDAIDVGCNIYWDISSGKIEREARNEFLIEVMKLAKESSVIIPRWACSTCPLKFSPIRLAPLLTKS